MSETHIFLIGMGAWCGSGIILFPIVWTRTDDLRVRDLGWLLFSVVIGPLSLLVFVDEDRVILRKRAALSAKPGEKK